MCTLETVITKSSVLAVEVLKYGCYGYKSMVLWTG